MGTNTKKIAQNTTVGIAKLVSVMSVTVGIMMVVLGFLGMFINAVFGGYGFNSSLKIVITGVFIFIALIPFLTTLLKTFIINKIIYKGGGAGYSNFEKENKISDGLMKSVQLQAFKDENGLVTLKSVFDNIVNIMKQAIMIIVKWYSRRSEIKEMQRLGSKIALQMEMWASKDDYVVGMKRDKADGTVEHIRGDNRALAVETDNEIIISVDKAPYNFTQDKLEEKANNVLYEYDADVVWTTKELAEVKVKYGKNDYYFNPKSTVRILKDNPLKDGWTVEDMKELPFNTERKAIYPAINMYNEKIEMMIKGISGIVMGGEGGSGKSAFIQTVLFSLLQSGYAKVDVMDGKGDASELVHFSGLAHYMPLKSTQVYNEELGMNERKRNLEDFAKRTNEIIEEMMERKQILATDGKDSNFWNRPLSKDMPIRVVVMDECHNFFEEEKAISELVKEENKWRTVIKQNAQTIIREFRSCGCILMLATQKPTSNTVPTSIRDICQLRVAFRVATTTSEIAILGERKDKETIFATQIPLSIRGMAVTINEDGQRQYVRYGFIREEKLIEFTNELKERKEKERQELLKEIKIDF